jgi:acyl carrier protein
MDEAQKNAYAERIIDYVLKEVIGRPGVELKIDTPLVSSGLIDSLALVNILLHVEDVTHMRIPASKVQPKDMDTVALMLATAERLGKPRK